MQDLCRGASPCGGVRRTRDDSRVFVVGGVSYRAHLTKPHI